MRFLFLSDGVFVAQPDGNGARERRLRKDWPDDSDDHQLVLETYCLH